MKINFMKLFAVLASLCIAVSAFASCGEKSKAPENDKALTETEANETPSSDKESSKKGELKEEVKEEAKEGVKEETKEDTKEDAKQESASAGENSQGKISDKYGNAEVYEKDGKPYAKTDDGKEVELTDENMGRLLEKYAKVQGSGSEEEKDLLNQIQVFLEAPRP